MDTTVVPPPAGVGLLHKQPESAVLLVFAYCKIMVGMRCRVHFPSHSDPDSYNFYNCCHGRDAVVHATRSNDSVDIRMLSGKREGMVQENISPSILIFDGPFDLLP